MDWKKKTEKNNKHNDGEIGKVESANAIFSDVFVLLAVELVSFVAAEHDSFVSDDNDCSDFWIDIKSKKNWFCHDSRKCIIQLIWTKKRRLGLHNLCREKFRIALSLNEFLLNALTCNAWSTIPKAYTFWFSKPKKPLKTLKNRKNWIYFCRCAISRNILGALVIHRMQKENNKSFFVDLSNNCELQMFW